MKIFKIFSFLLLSCTLFAGAARAGEYPSKPIHLVVPLAPGGTTDIISRLLAKQMAGILGQAIVIDNRSGAGGTIASNEVAHAAPDGYTILMGTIGTMAVAPAMYRHLPYDPDKDFSLISLVNTGQFVLVVNPKVEAKNFSQFLALAKSEPGAINFGSAGNGSTPHLGMELLQSMAGIKLVHVPYRGSGPMVTAVAGGQVQCGMPDIPSALSLIQAGRLRALAVTGEARSTALPDVPTIAESGFKNFNVTVWLGLVAPRGTPAPIVEKLNHAVKLALQDKAFIKRLAEISSTPNYSTPAEFETFYKSERKKWAQVVKESGAVIN
ncbi:Bug family tripartite tricarboxylate transporter substrate binding protein [Candidimonas nitroreducens]|uniref:LacI family transcriptional regulator n=1 Tax=Candidimonas nitroreducens TaxID=683354 RepID=A0A225M618_9BURK|nr:tripartite tricarboxylate transporter substrate binding protein [Candidimonas nitroreducens]OWT56728.1 LacI family transcriptional regulator [Candidimonas nitroreducens]